MKFPPLTEAEIDALPAACGRPELMRAFGIGHSRFNTLRQESAFDLFLLVPDVAGHRRYSGALLKAYLRGQYGDPMRVVNAPRAVTRLRRVK